MELRLRPDLCDAASPGFFPNAQDHVVTVVFTPPGGPRNLVVLAADCSALEAERQRCATRPDVASATCLQANAGSPGLVVPDLVIVERDGLRRLQVRFPDTEALLGDPADGRTFAGPATIAVTRAGDALPCELASQRCTDTPGPIACIDEYFAVDGTCRQNLDPTFSHFTALPPENSFQALCTLPIPPCTGTATEMRAAIDAAGNLLLPFDWQGVLARDGTVPVPRLLRASTALAAFSPSAGPIQIPGEAFLASYTPEGIVLPPIFEPQLDPTATNELTLFGSADAPMTVLRVARRSPVFRECAPGSAAAGIPCATDHDCGGSDGSCGPTSCRGGTFAGQPCSDDAACLPGGECGPSLFDFRDRLVGGVGPVVVPRVAPVAGTCEAGPKAGDVCQASGDCSGGLCVDYRLRAGIPVPVSGLGGTSDLFTFSITEAIPMLDLNGDGDQNDSVLTLRIRRTGEDLPIGAGPTLGRAVARIQQPPFSFPAVASEDRVVAFLEPEPAQGGQDANGDRDVFDTILRVFRHDGGAAVDLIPGLDLAVDAAPVIGHRSLAVSNGLVFFRTPEAAGAHQVTTRVNVAAAGTQANAPSTAAVSMSATGRFVAFSSAASNLVAGDTNGAFDVFVRDRDADGNGVFDEPGGVSVTRVSVASNGSQANGNSIASALSADGRWVAFNSDASNLVPDDTDSATDAFVHDLVTGETTRVSVASNGSQGNAASAPTAGGGSTVAISADGRLVVFPSRASNLVPGDTNGVSDVFVRDRVAGTTTRVSVASDGTQGNGASGSSGPPLGALDILLGVAVSADGRFVAFASVANNLVPGDTNGLRDVFVHDRATGTTTRVSVASDGSQGLGTAFGLGAILPSVSADGRYVAFLSDTFLAPTATSLDVYVRDRDADGDGVFDEPDAVETTHETVDLSGGVADGLSIGGTISADGRYVAFCSDASNLVAGDTNGATDYFVRDRVAGLTARVNVDSNGTQSTGNPLIASQVLCGWALSADGRYVGFWSAAGDLVAGDTNFVEDVFVHGPDPAAGAGELNGDNDHADTMLSVLDASTGPPASVTTLCPADAVAISGGRAAFLRPEAAGAAPGCPAGPGNVLDLNGDGDALDDVVHLWSPATGVRNLARAAVAVSLSDTQIAALVSEAGEGAHLNGDGDTADTVLMVHPVTGGSWLNVGQAADVAEVSGSMVAFITPEAAQGADLNLDEDTDDRVLQLFDAATAGLVNVGQAAEEFVLGSSLVAFRTREAAQGQDLNGDGDMQDDVLQVYDLTTGTLVNSGQAVTPCRLEACDPRQPYRVFTDTVKFLTLECDQGGSETNGCPGGGSDLNNDGDASDLVIQVLNIRSGTVRTIGTVAPGTGGAAGSAALGDPLRDPAEDLGSETPTTGGTQVFTSAAGRCLENGIDHGVCATDADCPAGLHCASDLVVVAAADADGDGVTDSLDNCPSVPNVDQADGDDDGVGDACDPQTCGNGVRELDEQCDDGNRLNGDCCSSTCHVEPGPCTPPSTTTTSSTSSTTSITSVSTTFTTESSSSTTSSSTSSSSTSSSTTSTTSSSTTTSSSSSTTSSSSSTTSTSTSSSTTSTPSSSTTSSFSTTTSSSTTSTIPPLSSPRAIKRAVLGEVVALRATATDGADARRLDDVIAALSDALDPALWIDDAHLDPRGGEQVFAAERRAARELSACTDITLAGLASRLVGADRTLAAVALAAASDGDARTLDAAIRELVKGDRNAARNDFDGAIDRYARAWRRAQETRPVPPMSRTPRRIKQAVLGELVALRASISERWSARRLDDAIATLTEALDPARWVDDTHLSAPDGEQVFALEEQVVRSIDHLRWGWQSPFFSATPGNLVDRLVGADRALAEIAIAEASEDDPKKLRDALEELMKGDWSAALFNDESAIDHYGKAWRDAIGLP